MNTRLEVSLPSIEPKKFQEELKQIKINQDEEKRLRYVDSQNYWSYQERLIEITELEEQVNKYKKAINEVLDIENYGVAIDYINKVRDILTEVIEEG